MVAEQLGPAGGGRHCGVALGDCDAPTGIPVDLLAYRQGVTPGLRAEIAGIGLQSPGAIGIPCDQRQDCRLARVRDSVVDNGYSRLLAMRRLGFNLRAQSIGPGLVDDQDLVSGAEQGRVGQEHIGLFLSPLGIRHVHGEARHLAGGERAAFGKGDFLEKQAFVREQVEGHLASAHGNRCTGEPEIAGSVGVERYGVGGAVGDDRSVLAPVPFTHDGCVEDEVCLGHRRTVQVQVLERDASVSGQVREVEVHFVRKRRGGGGFRDQQLRTLVHRQGRRRLLGGDAHAPGVAARADGPRSGRRGDGIEGIRGRRRGSVEGGRERGRRSVRGGRDGGAFRLPVVQGKQDFTVVFCP